MLNRDQNRTLGWLTDIVRQVFADREIIAPGTYCAYNAFAGMILLLASVLMWVDPGFGSLWLGIVLAAVALVLLLAIPVALRRPAALQKLLPLHGVLFILLGLWLAVGSTRWAFYAPPQAPFRYAPGLTLCLVTYGGLQLAGFGPWTKRARQLRLTGLWVGLACEIVVGAALLLRAFQP